MKIIACITTKRGKPDFDVFSCLQRAAEYARSKNIGVALCISADGYSVALCRNRGVCEFLKDPEATHLFFLDNDVHIQKDALVVLASLDASIAGGCYPSFKQMADNTYMCKPYLTVKKDDGWILRWFDGPLEVEGVGTGCMLIRRDVLEALGHPWFRWPEWVDEAKGTIERKSDDMDFCERARELGFNVMVHGNVRCGHMKQCDVANFIYEDRVLDIQWAGPLTIATQESWPDYGSHVPALVSLAKAFKIQHVVEYGSGRFSTPTFLDKNLFPDVTKLDSYEDDNNWGMDTLRRNPDKRFSMHLGPLTDMVKYLHPKADLVLIDTSEDPHDDDNHWFDTRKALIRAYQDFNGLLVVHDSSFKQLRPALETLPTKYRNEYMPRAGTINAKPVPTMVLSNSIDLSNIDWIHHPRKVIPNACQASEQEDYQEGNGRQHRRGTIQKRKETCNV